MTCKAVILGAGNSVFFWSNLDKPWYLNCIKHNNVPIPYLPRTIQFTIDPYYVTQLQGRNEL